MEIHSRDYRQRARHIIQETPEVREAVTAATRTFDAPSTLRMGGEVDGTPLGEGRAAPPDAPRLELRPRVARCGGSNLPGALGGGNRVSQEARARILSRVRDANRDREAVAHPGLLPEAVEPPVPFGEAGRADPLGAFEDRFQAAGGEVVRLADEGAAQRWLKEFTSDFESVAVCAGVPDALQPHLPEAPSSDAEPVLCSQSLFRFADLGDDGLCRGGPDKGCGVIVSAIDVVVDRPD